MAKEITGTHYEGEVSQKVFVEKDGKVLMCRAVGFDLWDFPGGRLHKGEVPRDGLIREVMEELGVAVVSGEAFFANVTTETASGIPRYQIIFRAELAEPARAFTPAPDEIEEVRWVGPEDVKSLKTWEDWRAVLAAHFGKYA